MSDLDRPLKVALTGGIATGKSYVLARLERLGVPTIDADVLAREVVAPGTPGLAAIRARFGEEAIAPDGTLDRKAIAARVFADASARQDLEAIIHPAVYERIQAWFDELAAAGFRGPAVADIPLVLETGHEADFDTIVATHCPPEMQVARLVARDHIGEDEARRRLAAQWPSSRKAAHADYVIDTSGTYDSTDDQVDRVHRALRQRAGQE